MASIDFSKKISSLPPPLKTLFYSDEVGLALKDALKLANLEEKRYFSPIMDLIARLLVLDISLEEFSLYLSDKLNLKQAQQQIIEKVLKDKIFNPVLPLLKQKPFFKQGPQTTQQISQKESLKIPFTPLNVSPLKLKEMISKGKPPTKNASLKETLKEDLTSQETKKEMPKEMPKEEEKKIQKESIEVPPIEIPEPVDIEVEEPLQQKFEMQQIPLPQVSPEEQNKIRETLLKIMTSKKEESMPILKDIENIPNKDLENISSKQPQKTKATAQISEVSEVVTGKGNVFPKASQPLKRQKDQQSILDIKIKEIEQKEEEIPKVIQKPIEYKKTKNPFGET